MGQNSSIEWTHHSANLWWGCASCSPGCLNCYAETLSKRWGNDVWGNDKPRKEVKSVWDDLAKYQKLAKEAGEMHRVFVGSMMDIFEKPMPLIDSKGKLIMSMDDENKPVTTGDLRKSFFAQINFGRYENLMFLLLTKRPSNINKYIPESWKEYPPANVMFGTSPVNQETCDKLIPQLLRVNGKRFLSVEPQLSAVNITAYLGQLTSINEETENELHTVGKGIEWIIQGGESGHHKRPFNLQWAYSLKKQCNEANVPYFFKQIDKVQPIPEDLMIRQFPK